MSKKQITLPSGGKCTVRKIAQSDYLASGQGIQLIQLARTGRSLTTQKANELSDADAAKMLQIMVDVTKVKLTRCCGVITQPDGTRVKIVDKPDVDDVGEGEVSIELLDQDDANAICAAVDELSGMTKEAARAAATFPEGSSDSGGVSPAGSELQNPAVGIAEPESV